MHYSDLQLLAQEPLVVKADGQKLLKFTLTAVGFLDAIECELDREAMRVLKTAATGKEATWDDARQLGQALSEALLPTEIFNLVNGRINEARARGEGIRLRLILSGSHLNNLPWEFALFNRGGGEDKISDFLCLMPNVSLVRHPAFPLSNWPIQVKPPVRVMIAAASPANWPSLEVAQEVALITKALENNAQVSVSTREHAQRAGLPDKTNPAHIFHFAGHGKFVRQQSATPGAFEGKSSLIFEDGNGKEDALDAELLAVQLRNAGVRVAVLGACQTAERDDINDWSSVAEALLKAELGAVVGMQFPVRDDSATSFAKHFYEALAVGLSIDEAVTAGRVAVASIIDDARGWANAALYLRAPDGIIFKTIAKDEQLADNRRRATVTIRQHVDTIIGRVVGPKIGHIKPGASVDIDQKAKDVFGDLEGPEIDVIG